MQNKHGKISLLLGPVLFALMLPLGGLDFRIRVSIGLILWMSVWWVMIPVHPAITAFLPVAVNALFNLVDMSKVISCYSAELIFLLAGSDLITMVWTRTGVDKRIAARALSLVGTSVKQQIMIWFLLATCLSAVLPNTVVAAVLCSIAISMLSYAGEGNVRTSETSSLVLLAIVWGANNGGMLTPLGGAMNLITVSYMEGLLQSELLYSDWVIRILPFGLLTTGVTALSLLFMKCSKRSLDGSKEYFKQLYKELPPLSTAGKLSLAAFAIAALLSFTRQLYQAYLPSLKPGYIFFIFGLLMFLLKSEDGKALLTWKKAESELMWGLFFLFAGGTALGAIVNNSGAAAAFAELISKINFRSEFLLIFIIAALNVVLSDVVNNTSCAAVTIPIVISIAQGLELPVLPYLWIATVSYNISYTLPTSIRAIPIGYGLDPKFMFRRGLLVTAIQIVGISVLGYLLMKLWPTFSTISSAIAA